MILRDVFLTPESFVFLGKTSSGTESTYFWKSYAKIIKTLLKVFFSTEKFRAASCFPKMTQLFFVIVTFQLELLLFSRYRM